MVRPEGVRTFCITLPSIFFPTLSFAALRLEWSMIGITVPAGTSSEGMTAKISSANANRIRFIADIRQLRVTDQQGWGESEIYKLWTLNLLASSTLAMPAAVRRDWSWASPSCQYRKIIQAGGSRFFSAISASERPGRRRTWSNTSSHRRRHTCRGIFPR